MNIILLDHHDWNDEHVVLVRDHRAIHIRSVLQSSVGDKLQVGLLGGDRGTGIIEAINDHGVQLRVEVHEPPAPRHSFDIVPCRRHFRPVEPRLRPGRCSPEPSLGPSPEQARSSVAGFNWPRRPPPHH